MGIHSSVCQGVNKENVEAVEQLIRRTLERLAVEGFEKDAITAAVNSLSFKLREFNTGSYPRGLSVMLAMLREWNFDRDPLQAIDVFAALAELQQDIANGKPVFQSILQTYFVSNEHCVAVEMVPDRALEARDRDEELQRLQSIKRAMSDEEVDTIVAETAQLRARQEAVDSAEARASLPSLSLADIDAAVKVYPSTCLRDSQRRGTVLTHALPSADILYADLAFAYDGLAFEDLPLLPLLARLLMESGTTERDASALAQAIDSHTGGLSVSFYNDLRTSTVNTSSRGSVVVDPDDPTSTLLYLVVRGKAVRGQLGVLVSLIEEVLLQSNLDNQARAVELLREAKARKESALLSSGHSFASARVSVSQSPSLIAYSNELTGGLTSVRAAVQLLEQAEQHWPDMQRRLEQMRATIVHTLRDSETVDEEATGGGSVEKSPPSHRKVVVNLTGDQRVLDEAVPAFEALLERLPGKAPHKVDSNATQGEQSLFAAWLQKKREMFADNPAGTAKRILCPCW
jgi:presequence protease